MASILEYGGVGRVILRAMSAFNKYKENDIIDIIENTDITIGYSTIVNSATQSVSTILNDYKYVIDYVNLNNVSMTPKLLDLFNTHTDNLTVAASVIEKPIANSNSLFLVNIPNTDSIQILDYSEEFKYESTTNEITGTFTEGKQYMVIFTVNKTGTKFNLNDSANIPYISMEIQLNGNADKVSGNADILLPRVRLVGNPILSSGYGEIVKFLINFKVIADDAKHKQSMIIYEE
jgi:hypothetical protein